MLALAQDFIRSLDDLSIERSSIEDLMKRFSVTMSWDSLLISLAGSFPE